MNEALRARHYTRLPSWKGRQMRKQVIAAAAWLRTERKRLGWSVADLMVRVADIADDLGWEGQTPDIRDLEALEAENLKQLPRWFKLLRYAVDHAEMPEGGMVAWLAERNFYFQTGDVRMARPLLFEDEQRFINTLDRLEEDQRRALRAFVTDFATRQCYGTKEEFAAKLLAKFRITATVLSDEDRELVDLFQSMKPNQRRVVLDMMRGILPHGEPHSGSP